jgi:peptidoglycan hydrolase-like protein with peptidoglycan-binding domain
MNTWVYSVCILPGMLCYNKHYKLVACLYIHMTKRIVGSLVLASLLFAGSSSVASAQATTGTADIAALQAQVQMLMVQIESLKAMSVKQHSQIEELRAELRLTKRLRKGDKGDDVKTLQEILATDPDIFPEGQVTGFFGPLTAKALRRFQERAGLESVGEVGPKTLELLNKFLAQGGAGNSGKVPEGLLRKADGVITVPLVMQNDSGLKGSAMIADNEDGNAVVHIKMMMRDDDMMQRPMESLEGGEWKMNMWKNTSTSTFPAHIHLGACPTPGAVAYPLTSIVGGGSVTVLATSTRGLIHGLPLAINVHKSETEMASFVACGDLKAPVTLWKSGGVEHTMNKGE